jgi:hypothetical protein
MKGGFYAKSMFFVHSSSDLDPGRMFEPCPAYFDAHPHLYLYATSNSDSHRHRHSRAYDTPLPPTNTPDVITALLPKGQPTSEWNGIPIMPGAIAGDGDAGSYRFTIQSSLDKIQKYYEQELSKLGWNFLATGEGESGAAILIFTDAAGGTLSVSIIPNGDQFIVMFVK